MIRIEISRRGIRSLERVAEEIFASRGDKLIKQIAREAHEEVVAHAPYLSPEHPYSERRIKPYLKKRGWEAFYSERKARKYFRGYLDYSHAPNIMFIVHACRPHPICPLMGDILALKPKYWVKHKERRKFRKGCVAHPGKRAIPFISEAFKEYRRKIKGRRWEI